MYLKIKRRISCFGWLLTMMLCNQGAMAQGITAQAAPVLTLPEALQYALKASHEARKAQLEVENAQYKIDEVKSSALPQLSANGSLGYNPILPLTALPGELAGQPGQTFLVAFGQKWNSVAALTLSQTLFDQSVFTGLKAARSTQEYYRFNMQLTEEQLIEKVANAYYQVMIQKHKIAVTDTTITTTTRILDIIKGQFDNGMAKQIDVDRIMVDLFNMQAQKQQLINSVNQLENQLKLSMGMSMQTPIDLPAIDYSTIKPQVLPLSDDLDFQNRTELRVLQQQERLLQYRKQVYKAEYYPSLTVSGNYGYQGLGNEFPWFKGRSVHWFDYASVALSLKVPIFNGFATRSRVKQADVEILKLKEDIDQTQLSLNLEYQNAQTQICNSLMVLKTQAANVELARKVFDNTNNNYNNGLATLTDLLDAEKSLTEANNNHSAALLDYKLAEIQMLKSHGDLKSLLNK